MARPPLTTADLPEGWQDKVIDLYANGNADIEIAVALGISRMTFSRLLKDDEEFLDTIQRGRELAEAWWLKQGREGLWWEKDGRRMDSKVYGLNMMNRFGWNKSDKDKDATAEGPQRLMVEFVRPKTDDPQPDNP